MSGITTGIGPFSGIDTRSLIDQLITLESRPRTLAQSRLAQLQQQQTAFLDLNSKLGALRSAASRFREANTFLLKKAVSSDTNVLSATAGTNAAVGTYTFLVDRLVSTQQLLTRGFSNRDSAAAGITELTFESARARLDRDVNLSDLNDGAGVSRGRIVITDSAGRVGNIDLSRAVTMNDVLDAINQNGTAQVTATVEGGKLVVKDNASGNVTVADGAGYTTATSLGLAGVAASGGKVTGNTVYRLNANTSLASLNDGNGVSIRNTVSATAAYNFTISIDNGGTVTDVQVNIGDVYEFSGGTLNKVRGAVTTIGGVIERINEALAARDINDVTVAIDGTNGRLTITDTTNSRSISVTENNSTTAADLGILSPSSDLTYVNGNRILAGLNTSLARSINGGSGIGGNGILDITTRDGSTYSVTLDRNASLDEMMRSIESATAGKLRVSLNSRGTGLSITDVTGSTASNLIIKGTAGADSAASLGISTGEAGVASNSVTGTNLQKKYISRATLVNSLPGGRSVGTGTFRITDSTGAAAVVDIGTDSANLGDIIDEINGKNLKAKARINANGDGIEIYEDNSVTPAGGLKIKVQDVSGTVARNLNISGEASDVGDSNYINGTFERRITFSAADTLDQVVSKINAAKVGVNAAVIADGTGATPFRVSISSSHAGREGRYLIDSGTFDLGISTLDAGNDSRVFFGSADPSRAVVVTGSTNTLDSVLAGVRIDLKTSSTSPTTLTVSSDTEGIEAAVGTFVTTFNTLVSRIGDLTKYDQATQRKGALLGDGTALDLRNSLFRTVQGRAVGAIGAFDQLADVGITVGTGGELKLDSVKFREALARDPESVRSLFTARTQIDNGTIDLGPGITARNTNAREEFSALGVLGQIEQMTKKYIDAAGGVLSIKSQSLDSQMKLQTKRIESFTTRLASRRAILERQFANMETTIARLQSQSNSLASLGLGR